MPRPIKSTSFDRHEQVPGGVGADRLSFIQMWDIAICPRPRRLSHRDHVLQRSAAFGVESG